jgi:hypothetical protein
VRRTWWGLVVALGCRPDAPCLEDRDCPTAELCVSGACVDAVVQGQPDLLYISEFRLRLEIDCGQCHFAGRGGVLPTPDDGRWRFYTGGVIGREQLQASWDDLQEWVAGTTPDEMPLLRMGRGAGTHPAVWRYPSQPEALRVVNWLWTFDGRGVQRPGADAGPPDAEPLPDGPSVPGFEILLPKLVAGCGCHVGDPSRLDNWFVSAAVHGLQPSYRATLRYVVQGDAAGSALVIAGAGGQTARGFAHGPSLTPALSDEISAWINAE